MLTQIIQDYVCSKSQFIRADSHQELRKRSAPCSQPPISELIVGHSHSHDDHTSGDAELRNFTSPLVLKTTIVPPHNVSALKAAYSIRSWPNSRGELDLGGRIVDIIPVPGHQMESIAVYDRQTGLLLTGDSVYPGRLYVPRDDFETFKTSHARMKKFVEEREVSWVLGCHIEQKRVAFEEYPQGTVWQPDEHVLQFQVDVLGDIELALESIDGKTKGQKMFAEFSVVVS